MPGTHLAILRRSICNGRIHRERIATALDGQLTELNKDRRLTTMPVQLGDAPVSSSCKTAAVNCAGAKGFSIRMLSTTPFDFQSGAPALVT